MPVPTRSQQLELLGLQFPLPAPDAFKVDLNRREEYILLLYAIQDITASLEATSGGAPAVPVNTNVAVNQTVDTLRDSQVPKVVRIVNQGPDPITVTYGETVPVYGTTGVTLAAGDVDESPRPVIGKIRAICATGETATATIVTF